MDTTFQEKFLERWKKYFGQAELPFTFYYTNTPPADVEPVKKPSGQLCIVGVLARVRRGTSLVFENDTIGCFGGKSQLGFSQERREGFEYFLSTGLPGQIEGERYRKTPELVKAGLLSRTPFVAPAPYAVFKRWDRLTANDHPEVAIFFATPDTLSGLYTLAHFDRADQNGVICPAGAGCSTFARYPYLEKDSADPKAVLGLFDVSARPFVPKETLSFSLPLSRLKTMTDNMDESFLQGRSWARVLRRD